MSFSGEPCQPLNGTHACLDVGGHEAVGVSLSEHLEATTGSRVDLDEMGLAVSVEYEVQPHFDEGLC